MNLWGVLMKEAWITLDDLDALALGATVLGSGGGGSPHYDLVIAKQQLKEHGPVRLISVDDIPSDSWVLPVYWVGAPMVLLEKPHSGKEFEIIVEKMQELIPGKVSGLMSAEIGGTNALTPVSAAGALGLPVVDGDLMGRAFPFFYMSTCGLYDVKPSPGVIVDTSTDASVVVNTKTSLEMDRLLRILATAMGSCAALSSHPLSQLVAQKVVIRGTVKRALHLGRCMQRAIDDRLDLAKIVLESCGGCLVASGYISDVEYRFESAIQYGYVVVTADTKHFTIYFQNEFLAIVPHKASVPLEETTPLATTPDIIVVIEVETGQPLSTEKLRHGLRVQVLVLPPPTIWTSPEGLRLVGPKEFGFPWDYKPKVDVCQSIA